MLCVQVCPDPRCLWWPVLPWVMPTIAPCQGGGALASRFLPLQGGGSCLIRCRSAPGSPRPAPTPGSKPQGVSLSWVRDEVIFSQRSVSGSLPARPAGQFSHWSGRRPLLWAQDGVALLAAPWGRGVTLLADEEDETQR